MYLISFCQLPERATRSEGRSRPTFLKLALSCGSVKNGAGRLALARFRNACKLSLLPKGTLHAGPPAYIIQYDIETFIFRIIIVFREFCSNVTEIIHYSYYSEFSRRKWKRTNM